MTLSIISTYIHIYRGDRLLRLDRSVDICLFSVTYTQRGGSEVRVLCVYDCTYGKDVEIYHTEKRQKETQR